MTERLKLWREKLRAVRLGLPFKPKPKPAPPPTPPPAPKQRDVPYLIGVASPYDPDVIEWYDRDGDLRAVSHVAEILQ